MYKKVILLSGRHAQDHMQIVNIANATDFG